VGFSNIWCAVCGGVVALLQCVAACCSVLQSVAVCGGVWRCVVVCDGVLQSVYLYRSLACSMLPVRIDESCQTCGAVCCSVLQCVAMCCSVSVYGSVLQ